MHAVNGLGVQSTIHYMFIDLMVLQIYSSYLLYIKGHILAMNSCKGL